MKKTIGVLLSIFILISGCLCGCLEDNSVEGQQRKATNDNLQQMNDEIGMPNIKTFYEKKQLKKIYELRDDSDLICYAYTMNSMTGKYVFITKCIGYGIPYSTQYSCPEKPIYSGTYNDGIPHYEESTISQPEPNGLYTATGLSATWIISIDGETGEQKPMYVEPEIVVSETKLPRRICDESSLPSDY